MGLNLNIRRQIAALARGFYAGQIDYRTFLDRLPVEADETEDEEVGELLDMIEHQPAKSRFWGLPPRQHADYLARVQLLIQRLSGQEIKDEKPST